MELSQQDIALVKRLGMIKSAVGITLVIVGIMGGLEALVGVWKLRAYNELGFYPVVYQLFWGVGNAAFLLIGILFFQQGKILMKPIHTVDDRTRLAKSKKRTNVLIIAIMLMALLLVLLNFLSSREQAIFLNTFR